MLSMLLAFSLGATAHVAERPIHGEVMPRYEGESCPRLLEEVQLFKYEFAYSKGNHQDNAGHAQIPDGAIAGGLEVKKAYEAGPSIKLGTAKAIGSVKLPELDLSRGEGETLRLVVEAHGWTKSSQLEVKLGDTSLGTITLPAEATLGEATFQRYELELTPTATTGRLEISTMPKSGSNDPRAFIHLVKVTKTVDRPEAPAPDPVAPTRLNSLDERFDSAEGEALPEGWTSYSEYQEGRLWKTELLPGTQNRVASITAYKSVLEDGEYTTLLTPMLDLSEAKRLSFRLSSKHSVAGTILKLVALGEQKQLLRELAQYDYATDQDNYVSIDIPADDKIFYLGFVYIGYGVEGLTTTYRLDEVRLGAPEDIPAEEELPALPEGYLLKEDFEASGSLPRGWQSRVLSGSEERSWVRKTYKENSYVQFSAYAKSGNLPEMEVQLSSPRFAVEEPVVISYDIKAGQIVAGTVLDVVLLSAEGEQIEVLKSYNYEALPEGNKDKYYMDEYVHEKLSLDKPEGSYKLGFLYRGGAGKTTTYQIDNVIVEPSPKPNAVALVEEQLPFLVKVEPRGLSVTPVGQQWVAVYNLSGKQLYRQKHSTECQLSLPQGVYIVEVGGKAIKVQI